MSDSNNRGMRPVVIALILFIIVLFVAYELHPR
jgi:hypothetical protein